MFDALRREVKEETGLVITKILGEDESFYTEVNGNRVINFTPFCVCQNMSGLYSIVLNVFICYAEGELLEKTDESINIRWERVEDVKRMLQENKEKFFLMDITPLNKYLNIK
ncbi:NUDIX domain-containing protein [Miniphocaeibacter halophilus]|uniref:NUDIX domain-containing protein n=1 Tax=Miniphocaeibacter halophilus TaxID=2931922 RepID=UPI0021E18CA2|nr:NUDIX domain-containing protein [Miniphocaeibacter halophilus]